MTTVRNVETVYEVDEDGFLLKFNHWDEDFATETARECGITSGLADSHRRIIRWIRRHVLELGVCPLADLACRANGLQLADLRGLFPSGYLRGACRIAGITHDQGVCGPLALPRGASRSDPAALPEAPEGTGAVRRKTYIVDVRGFLVHPEEWDEEFAVSRAWEMKMPALTDRHWKVIWHLRRRFNVARSIPAMYEICEELAIHPEEFTELFPDGYHGGAVKIAGLRAAARGDASREA